MSTLFLLYILSELYPLVPFKTIVDLIDSTEEQNRNDSIKFPEGV